MRAGRTRCRSQSRRDCVANRGIDQDFAVDGLFAQARREVDRLAEDVALVQPHFAGAQRDAHVDGVVGCRQVSVVMPQAILHGARAQHRVGGRQHERVAPRAWAHPRI